MTTATQTAAPTAETAHRRIFVFVDPSEHSKGMWRWVQEHSVRENDHVTLVTVAQTNLPIMALDDGMGMLTPMVDATAEMERQAIEDAKEEACTLLDGLKNETSLKGWTLDWLVLTTKGLGVAETVVEFLKQHEEADEAIVGTRQMGSFKKAMMTLIGNGSVSDHVVQYAPCTVLVVHPPPVKDEVAAANKTE